MHIILVAIILILIKNLPQNSGKNYEQSTSLVSITIRSVPRHIDKFVADFHDCSLDIIGMCENRMNVELEPLYVHSS